MRWKIILVNATIVALVAVLSYVLLATSLRGVLADPAERRREVEQALRAADAQLALDALRLERWLEANAGFRADVLARLRAEGPLLASEIPDTAQVDRAPDGWYGKNQVPHMLDFLSRQGLVAIVGREGRHRRWDLAERVYPSDVPDIEPEEAARALAERRLQAAGIAKLKSPWSQVADAGEPAAVEGSKWKFRVDPEALAALDGEDEGRVAFLNPYDPMLFDRPRLAEVFEFEYVLEQFKPKPQRVYGYFAHPILMGDRFVGMLDLDLQQHALGRIECRFPELLGVHLAKALVALDRETAPAYLENGLDQLDRDDGGHTLVLATPGHVGDLIAEGSPVHTLGEVVTGLRDGQLHGFSTHASIMRQVGHLRARISDENGPIRGRSSSHLFPPDDNAP